VEIFAFALTMSVSSCEKDESNIILKEMLTAKSWKLFSMNTHGVTFLEDCAKDYIMTFAAEDKPAYVVITENQLVVTLKDGTNTMEIKLIPV